MHFGPLCMQLRLRINFLDPVLTQKFVDQPRFAKSYKHSAKMIFAIQ